MKNKAILSLFAAAALVSGCRIYEGGSTRHTIFDNPAPAKKSGQTVKPAKIHASPQRAGNVRSGGEVPVHPVDVNVDRPVSVDDVGPAGRVRPKTVQPAPAQDWNSAARQVPGGGSSRPPAGYVPATQPRPAETGAYRVHTVQPGETALEIAIANGMTLDQLKSLNPDVQRDPDHLRVGQGLRVRSGGKTPPGGDGRRNTVVDSRPAGGSSTPAPIVDRRPQPEPAPQKAGPGEYVVKQGDTLSDIAHREGGTVAEWKAANGLSDGDETKIKVGRKLVRPGSRPANPQPGKNAGKNTADNPPPPPPPDADAAPRDAEAPPPPPKDVIVPGSDSTVEDVLSVGLSGARDKSRAEREAAEKAAREAEEARLEAARKEAEKAKREAEEAKRKAEETLKEDSGDSAPGKYTVQPEDDIFTIALKFNVAPIALRKANGSDLSVLKPGQTIVIPQSN